MRLLLCVHEGRGKCRGVATAAGQQLILSWETGSARSGQGGGGKKGHDPGVEGTDFTKMYIFKSKLPTGGAVVMLGK